MIKADEAESMQVENVGRLMTMTLLGECGRKMKAELTLQLKLDSQKYEICRKIW